ncbi:Tectonic-1 isoform 2 [Schistosoma japonicum]|uniref:Tectonic-1 isoform 2 n=1 Tax=Schistosoma japonicum TaxID=6182 RepID=A0A4Z2DC93_SCHJA|nr:Tectonic-1 isoform 2 [Schistosoma japonicum]
MCHFPTERRSMSFYAQRITPFSLQRSKSAVYRVQFCKCTSLLLISGMYHASDTTAISGFTNSTTVKSLLYIYIYISFTSLYSRFGQSFVSYCTWSLEDTEATVNFGTTKIKCNRLSDVLLTVKDSAIFGKMKLSEIDNEQIIPILTCYEQNTNIPISCPTTTPNTIVDNSNGTVCSSVPISVYFKITYEIIGKITQFEMYAIIGNVTKIFTQKYEVEFVQVNTSNVLPMSGNPGYLIGRPIVGAKINITDLSSLGQLGSTASVTTMLPTTNMKLSIDGIKQPMNNGVWNILAGGSCGVILQERGLLVEPIRFGEDAFSGCTLSLSYLEQFINYEMDWTTRCTQYQNIIWANLLNPLGMTSEEDRKGLGIQFMTNKPDLLAIWPISKLNRSSEWIPIQNVMNYNVPPTPRGLNGLALFLILIIFI